MTLPSENRPGSQTINHTLATFWITYHNLLWAPHVSGTCCCDTSLCARCPHPVHRDARRCRWAGWGQQPQRCATSPGRVGRAHQRLWVPHPELRPRRPHGPGEAARRGYTHLHCPHPPCLPLVPRPPSHHPQLQRRLHPHHRRPPPCVRLPNHVSFKHCTGPQFSGGCTNKFECSHFLFATDGVPLVTGKESNTHSSTKDKEQGGCDRSRPFFGILTATPS